MAHGLNCTAWLGNRISEEESLHRSTCAVGYYTLGGFGASMFSNSGRGLRSGNRLYRRFSQRDLRRLAPVSAYQSKKNSFCVLNALNSPVFHVSSHLNCAFVNANYSFAFHAFYFFFFPSNCLRPYPYCEYTVLYVDLQPATLSKLIPARFLVDRQGLSP